MIAAADEAALEAAIGALPHLFREVIVMRDINGLSYREIAAAIGAPIGTVMSRLARGRALSLSRASGGRDERRQRDDLLLSGGRRRRTRRRRR